MCRDRAVPCLYGILRIRGDRAMCRDRAVPCLYGVGVRFGAYLMNDGLYGIVLIGPQDHEDFKGFVKDDVLGDHFAEVVWV